MKIFYDIIKNKDGATAIEYGLIAALIGVAIITSLSAVGNSISASLSATDSSLKSATQSTM